MLNWTVLGRKSLPIRFDHDFEVMLREMAAKKKEAKRFLAMLDKVEIIYTLHAVREVHVFTIKFDPETSEEDFKWFEKIMEGLLKSIKQPLLALEGQPQPGTVVLSADKDVNEYAARHQEPVEDEPLVTQEVMQDIPAPKKAPKAAAKEPAAKKAAPKKTVKKAAPKKK